MKKVIIIGGVAGGASTAARLRRRDENAQIILFERGEYISYANCGLPYYIGDTIQSRDKLFVQSVASFSNRFRIDIRNNTEVIQILSDQKKVKATNLKTNETYEESYDKLVLSPGADPVRPPIPGVDLPGIFTLRNVPDTDVIKNFVEEKKPKRAVIVGAGFIGLEMAENLHQKGIFVTIVEMAEQVMTPLDYEMAAGVHSHLKTKQVEFYLGDAVSSFTEKGNKLLVGLKSEKQLVADMVILSIGVRPDTSLCKDANIQIGPAGGIQVNKHLQTSVEDIYAIGDAIEFENPLLHQPMTAYLAGPANKQGRIVANNIVDDNQWEYTGSISTAIAKVFDLTVASTGLAEKTLTKNNIPYCASITHSASHAGYYPGAQPMTIKIQFSPEDGRLLGAQAVGYQGVDKRIDLLATVLKQGGTIYDLIEIEHAYAPPFSSAKDPVNMAGFVAENILEGLVKIIHWQEIDNLNPDKDFLLDVRTKAEVELGTIPGSAHIPIDELRGRLDELPKDKRLIIFCAVGLRGYLACRILTQNGFKEVYNLTGGYKTFEHTMQKQSNEDIFDDIAIAKDDHLYTSKNNK